MTNNPDKTAEQLQEQNDLLRRQLSELQCQSVVMDRKAAADRWDAARGWLGSKLFVNQLRQG